MVDTGGTMKYTGYRNIVSNITLHVKGKNELDEVGLDGAADMVAAFSDYAQVPGSHSGDKYPGEQSRYARVAPLR